LGHTKQGLIPILIFLHHDNDMNRIPPSLLYLTIYNPTLRLSELPEDDDEDAEEQAHILFYTSKERAVSRDRMLRQVGLAKALVNFAQYDFVVFGNA
jgi:hypothetical protein